MEEVEINKAQPEAFERPPLDVAVDDGLAVMAALETGGETVEKVTQDEQESEVKEEAAETVLSGVSIKNEQSYESTKEAPVFPPPPTEAPPYPGVLGANRQPPVARPPPAYRPMGNIDPFAFMERELRLVFEDELKTMRFIRFMSAVNADENVLFWWACEDFLLAPRPADERTEKARQIWNHFFENPKQAVHVTEATKTKIESILSNTEEHVPTDLYADAQKDVFRFMARECMPTYLKALVSIEMDKVKIETATAAERTVPHMVDIVDLAQSDLEKLVGEARVKNVENEVLRKKLIDQLEDTPLAPVKPEYGEILHRYPARNWRFDFSINQWTIWEPSAESIDATRLRVVTYNVCRQEFGAKYRHPVILQILRTLNADVIMLQEVSKGFLAKLTEADWVREKYFLSDTNGSTFLSGDFGQIVMSKYSFHQLKNCEMRTRSAYPRQSMVCSIIIRGRVFGFTSLQLDYDHRDDELRSNQLATTLAALKKMNCQDAVIGGDFGCNRALKSILKEKEYASLFMDLWTYSMTKPIYQNETAVTISPVESMDVSGDAISIKDAKDESTEGYTYDPESNGFLAKLLGRRVGETFSSSYSSLHSVSLLPPAVMNAKAGRFDRLIFFSENSVWNKLVSIQLFGNTPIPPHKTLFPSSHFGIVAMIECDLDALRSLESSCIIS